jgi:hypothetical protein
LECGRGPFEDVISPSNQREELKAAKTPMGAHLHVSFGDAGIVLACTSRTYLKLNRNKLFFKTYARSVVEERKPAKEGKIHEKSIHRAFGTFSDSTHSNAIPRTFRT